MKFLYLDIDGVLNGHQRHENGYCRTDPACVRRLNAILAAVPDVDLIISSAWRYLVLTGAMRSDGFSALLLSLGLNCYNRLAGFTGADELFLPAAPTAADYADLTVRSRLIYAHAADYPDLTFVVLDDLALPMPELIQTDGDLGLQDAQVTAVLRRLP